MKNDFINNLYRESEYYDTVCNSIKLTIKSGLSEHDLDDCIADVYLIAVKKRHILENHPDVKGWLGKTAIYVARRFIKRRFIESGRLSGTSDELANVLEKGDEEQRAYNELLDSLKRKLKFSEFTLFTLKFIKDNTTEEIAEIINIKPHSVEVRITRLKNKIKNILYKM